MQHSVTRVMKVNLLTVREQQNLKKAKSENAVR